MSNTLSVIIPAFNVELYISQALQSLKRQTISPSEIILVDDGSTDKTVEIAQTFSFSCPFRVIRTVNRGQGEARNLGIESATSDFIYFFDSDDLLPSNFIETIGCKIAERKTPVDMLLFSGQSFSDEPYERFKKTSYKRGITGEFSNRYDFLRAAERNAALFCSPCMYVTRLAVWRENRLRFMSKLFEDEAIWFPLIFSCSKFEIIDEVLFYRRYRPGSTMTMNKSERHIEGAKACVVASAELLSKSSIAADEKEFIKRRLARQIVRYLILCSEAKTWVDLRFLGQHILMAPCAYLQIMFARSMNRFLRWKKFVTRD